MTFRFVNSPGPAGSAASLHPEEREMSRADQPDGNRARTALTGRDNPATTPIGTAQTLAPTCSVEQACAAFHAAHAALMNALTESCDEVYVLNVVGLSELSERRDVAFRQVRSRAACTSSAYRAKLRVLAVMRDWFAGKDVAGENADVVAFAIEMAIEAAELLDDNGWQACGCRVRPCKTNELQLRGGGERWRPVSWLARSWRNAMDTPFAN